jgi:chromosome transmission fidelity protein 18
MLQSSKARQNRSSALAGDVEEEDEVKKENLDPQSKAAAKSIEVKRDFFGRVIEDDRPSSPGKDTKKQSNEKVQEQDRVWVSFHEGFSNAVRKPITLRELLDSF